MPILLEQKPLSYKANPDLPDQNNALGSYACMHVPRDARKQKKRNL